VARQLFAKARIATYETPDSAVMQPAEPDLGYMAGAT
jgi:hypothetical protein